MHETKKHEINLHNLYLDGFKKEQIVTHNYSFNITLLMIGSILIEFYQLFVFFEYQFVPDHINMTHINDEQALLFLLKSPKKKYIKHLLEYSACLSACKNSPPYNYKTPLIESFQSDMELTKQQSHRLLIALSQLVEAACAIGFDFQNKNIFSQQFDTQLKQILINTLQALQHQIQESRENSMRIGNKLIDFNWKLDLQIASEKGKSNTPNVTIQIQSLKNAELRVDKMQMRGEQFMAFFGNMKKIKQNLLQLVDKGQKSQ